jgi:hypothetical protein
MCKIFCWTSAGVKNTVSGLSQTPCLLPKAGCLTIQIHEIFLVIDLYDGPYTVAGTYPVPDLERFFTWHLRLWSLGSQLAGLSI